MTGDYFFPRNAPSVFLGKFFIFQIYRRAHNSRHQHERDFAIEIYYFLIINFHPVFSFQNF